VSGVQRRRDLGDAPEAGPPEAGDPLHNKNFICDVKC